MVQELFMTLLTEDIPTVKLIWELTSGNEHQ